MRRQRSEKKYAPMYPMIYHTALAKLLGLYQDPPMAL